MANGGHGPAAPGAELERLARQYWNAWQDALQRTMPGATQAGAGFGAPGAFAGPADPWQGVLDWWTRQAAPERSGAEELLARFNGQAGAWFTQMQQLAGRFAGQDATPEAVVAAWRDALGGAGANPFAQMLSGMRGPGIEGWDTWAQRLAPLFGQLGGHGRDWHELPTFGLTREHQERWQGFAHALADYQRSQQAFQALLQQGSQNAFVQFETRLRTRDASQPIDSPRALFDLWIDAAEDAYAEVALSPPFRSAYADMVAGQMRLRQAVQVEIEQLCRLFDLPTRTELDGAHRKLADLERVVRRLRDRVEDIDAGATDARSPAASASAPPRRPAGPTRVVVTPAAGEAGTVSAPTAATATGTTRRPAAKAAGTARAKTAANKTTTKKTATRKAARTPVAKKAATVKAAAKKTVTKKAPAKKAPTNKAAARKTAAKKTTAKTTAAKKTATRKTTATRSTRATVTKRAGRTGAGARRGAASSGAVPKGTAAAAATTARDAVAGTTRTRRTSPARASRRSGASRRGSARGTSSPAKRATRAAAPVPSRAGRLPNHGFVSPIPEAPAPMKSGKPARRKR